MGHAIESMDEIDARSEHPERDRLRDAQKLLKDAGEALKAAQAALARGQERLKTLSDERTKALAEETAEARDRAVSFETGVAAVILTGASRRRGDLDDQFASLDVTIGILERKVRDAQQDLDEAMQGQKRAVQDVVNAEASPLLSRMRDCENAALYLRLELQALSYLWSVTPPGLSNAVAGRPSNYVDRTLPLSAPLQKFYDGRKSAWQAFADRLRTDADFELSRGD